MNYIIQPKVGICDENHVIKKEDFYISYNPGTGKTFPMFAGDGGVGSDETAIVKDGNFYILNGDFRKEYEEIVDQGFEACYKFFESKPELKSSWSD